MKQFSSWEVSEVDGLLRWGIHRTQWWISDCHGGFFQRLTDIDFIINHH
jgi:hypothetical protein